MTPGQHIELVAALHGPWRAAARIVIILPSTPGTTAPEIADPLHYEPVTVRRGIARHTRDGIAGFPTGRAADAPAGQSQTRATHPHPVADPDNLDHHQAVARPDDPR